MLFGRQAVARIAGALVTLVTAVALALRGYSYWSLAWGTLVGTLAGTVLTFVLAPFRPVAPVKGAGIRDMVTFGANVTAFNLVNYFARNLDNILIGRFLGADSLGFYSRAYQLLMFPIDAIREPMNAVAFPAMSRLKAHPAAYRLYYRRTSLLLAFSSMPVTAFLFVASDPVIDLLLGPDWSEVSRIFALLAITGFIQPVAGLRGNVLLSSGRARRYLWWGIFNAACVCIGFLVGIRWGVVGIAASYAVVNYAILYPSLLLAFKDTPLRPADFFDSIWIPAAASLAAVALSFPAARLDGINAMNPLMQVLILGFIFAVTYLAVVATVPGGRQVLSQLFALVPYLQRRKG
jgi:PST family polysaccharide transporter